MTAQEFIAYAKANPGKINYASQGIGTTSHLTAALFEKVTGTKMVHVPYKGTAPALNALIASHVDMIFMELASAIKLHRAGKARILAVATDARIADLPDIPTLNEAGVKGLRVRHLECDRRAAENAAGHRRQAQHGGQRSAHRAPKCRIISPNSTCMPPAAARPMPPPSSRKRQPSGAM